MKTKFIAALLALSSIAANAGMCTNDSWKPQSDKQLHFMAHALLAETVTVASNNPWIGFGTSVAAGGIYELFDQCTSKQDFGYDIAGAALGAVVGDTALKFVIKRNFVGVKTKL